MGITRLGFFRNLFERFLRNNQNHYDFFSEISQHSKKIGKRQSRDRQIYEAALMLRDDYKNGGALDMRELDKEDFLELI